MNNPVTTSRDEIGELRKEFDRLKSDLSDMRSGLTDLTGDAVRTAKAGVAETKHRIEHSIEAAGAKGKESMEAVEQQVAAHPYLALGAALVVGLIVGCGWAKRG